MLWTTLVASIGLTTLPLATIYPQTPSGEPVVIEGVRNSLLNYDEYLGIPFAAPPVGDLRLANPQDPTWNVTTFSASSYSPACLQAPSEANDAYGQSEDCLYLNVITPLGIDYTQQSVPVMVWIYGGAFTSGTASIYNSTVLMATAQATDRPIIFVSINYRLGVFGFPYVCIAYRLEDRSYACRSGKEVAQAGIANLGMKDVIKSLEWVQEHIWAFGGDAGQVTIAGQSAGAILVSLLYLQPNQSLFNSAIMESGSQSVAPIAPTAEFWQGAFDLIQNYTNCSAPVTTQSNTSVSRRDSTDLPPEITCLKYVPAEELLKAQLAVKNTTEYGASFIFAPSIDGDLIPASPHELLAEGKFSMKPFISGDVYDEGTAFVPAAYTNYTQQELPFVIEILQPIPASNATVLEEVGEYYPNIPALGSPFGTGNETFGLPPQYKQLAAIFGDATFQANRRWFLDNANQYGLNETWSYLFGRAVPGTPPRLGVPHSSELPYVFGAPQLQALGGGLAGLPFGQPNYTSGDAMLSKQVVDYWINFVYYLDPNGDYSGNETIWPTYTEEKNMLFMNVSNITVIPDTYRESQMDFFLSNPKTFNYKRWLGLE
ncbi:Alpha/Beta hydrolase protein [Kockovaella imperatae]|uniref:Carboxylic ester hydrolase n=1 Tax=Kockovaella imperatae TaxID=4999 RepID=A0A1Y1U960_9TREE|nr:Alpha/Beta hydrolase protein [Kockovaella imperatae]ORX34047.1 Alpha/Beta hydrolase protein [Kockovaella imperatae]